MDEEIDRQTDRQRQRGSEPDGESKIASCRR